MPRIINKPRVISKTAFAITRLFAVINEGTTKSEAKETQESGVIA
jgi:hypothetical protein